MAARPRARLGPEAQGRIDCLTFADPAQVTLTPRRYMSIVSPDLLSPPTSPYRRHLENLGPQATINTGNALVSTHSSKSGGPDRSSE